MGGLASLAAFGSNAFVRRRVFVSYHHGGDQAFYDAFSKAFHDAYELISDTSLERRIDSDDVNYVLRRIRENYITGSSCTIVLVGSRTWARKYVDWEIEATLQKGHGLIGVRLPTLLPVSNGLYPLPDRLFDNVSSGYAIWTDWATMTASRYALVNLIEAANAKKYVIDRQFPAPSPPQRVRTIHADPNSSLPGRLHRLASCLHDREGHRQTPVRPLST